MPHTDNTLPIPNILTLHTLLSSNPPLRPSLRQLSEPRDLNISIVSSAESAEARSVEVRLGETYVSCKVSAQITEPFEDRPFEGTFSIGTEITAMCSPAFSSGGNADFTTAAPAVVPTTVIPIAQTSEAGNGEVTAASAGANTENTVTMGGGAVMGLAADQAATEVLLSRLIEKAVRRSNALDLESLCIIAGQKCWAIRADVRFLNYDGNLVDAASIAVITALLHFRKPDVEVVGSGEGSDLVIYDEKQREMVPLSVLHIPICVTFQFFSTESVERNIKGESKHSHDVSRTTKEDSDDEGDVNDRMDVDNATEGPRASNEIIIVDATAEEELLSQGSMTVTLNSNKELCQISKSGGLNVDASRVLECCQIASQIVDKWTKQIKNVLAEDEAKHRDLRVEKELSVVNDRSTK
jgi:exosome complex component RRP45